MEKIKEVIIKENLISVGDTVGVACSGGIDSMCLLVSLSQLAEEMHFKVMAINVDHCIRGEASTKDSEFVENYCKRNNIPVKCFKIDALKISEEKKIGVELAAREARYKVFNGLVDKGIVNKIALGHHMVDQAETILLNILRGSGLGGAKGMTYMRDNRFIRPMLNVSKAEIRAFVNNNEIPFVEDETNKNKEYSRNYLRNVLMPMIRSKWPNADQTICNFGKVAKEDDEYIYSTINDSGVIVEGDNTAKIPTSYFAIYKPSAMNRIIIRAFNKIGATVDIERKHLKIIMGLALEGENGNKINLPHKISVIKEYNYVTITNKNLSKKKVTYRFERENNKLNIPDFGVIEIRRTTKRDPSAFTHLVDAKKIPVGAVWRYREDGDLIEKFGGGTKSLSDYLIDKKVPSRIRHNLPVLAINNEILIIAGVEISNKVRVDENTRTALGINVVRF